MSTITSIITWHDQVEKRHHHGSYHTKIMLSQSLHCTLPYEHYTTMLFNFPFWQLTKPKNGTKSNPSIEIVLSISTIVVGGKMIIASTLSANHMTTIGWKIDGRSIIHTTLSASLNDDMLY